MPLNETETRVLLIEPKLEASGWKDEKVKREYYYQNNYKYTEGKIILLGDKIERGRAKRVDYLLRISESLPIAVIEAKAESELPEAGLEQAKAYAQDLGLSFAYSTNGHKIIEYDFFTHSIREIENFPTPIQLYERWKLNNHLLEHPSFETKLTNPLVYPYCPKNLCGNKSPFYFQEIAIREIILRIMRGQKRILLTMATGTGKTFVALQVVWKLVKSGWLKQKHPDKPARILFLTDRIVLRNQAYNTFSPFATGHSEPRYLIEGHPANLNRDFYFGIYQTLWSEDEKGIRLFEKYPSEFFDLIIIDECHRSGWGTWREILDHFSTAIHLGMTATPKRDENVDTYSYFCAEEPEVFIDPNDHTKGKWKPPAFQYSLGQGIEDGFLATYKVHRVRTTVDVTGLRLEDAVEQGAEVYIPEDVEPREIYTTPQFEREITLPDRTREMVKHLASLLRQYGHMEKTMVFCVDMDHARTVARFLQEEFGPSTGLDNYAVPIISEEGENARRWLEEFADSNKISPVVATTAELLSTGIDVPSCRNIVFMKTVSSPVLFKQIIGRGSRIDPSTEKYWFRIIDYTGATRLFEQWDRPEGKPVEIPKGPFIARLEGSVHHAYTNDLIVGASISVRAGHYFQQGPIRTDEKGRFIFESLPEGKLTVIASAPGFVRKELRIDTLSNQTVFIEILLKPESRQPSKIIVENLEVEIADEFIFTIDTTGQRMTLSEYKDYTRNKVYEHTASLLELWEIWIDSNRRKSFMEDLRNSGIHPEILKEIERLSESDTFDFLANLAFGAPIRNRSDRANSFLNREQSFIKSFGDEVRPIIIELIDKYRAGGIEQLEPEIFSVSPFRELGGAFSISKMLGGIEKLSYLLEEMRKRIYPKQEVQV